MGCSDVLNVTFNVHLLGRVAGTGVLDEVVVGCSGGEKKVIK